MAVSDDLTRLIEPLVGDLGYEFVGLEYQSNPKNRLVRLYIDRPGIGVTLDDCELVSREVSALMDVEDPVSGQYTLEVSSPGLERPLFTAEQFRRFAGEKARVFLYEPLERRRKITAVIVGVDESAVLELDDAGERLHIDMNNIRRAHLAPDMDELLASGGHAGTRE